ncbi:AAA family ATPase [Bradyrhizobium sp. RT7b]|uniref:AAA family ATPase n=1 Tax=unclassified Bradyrhizobium TaxID=2631580 RepID=UPI003391DC16
MKADANSIMLNGGPPALREEVDRAQHFQREKNTAAEESMPAALHFTLFKDFGALGKKRWVQKGIIALGETSAWIAPPGAGKSALLTEISFHVGTDRDWRGHRSKGRYAVVIFALERADLYRRRLQVYHERNHGPDLPIAIVDRVINVMAPTVGLEIVSTVKAVEAATGLPVGLIIIDTYPKAIAAGGGDEDKARDQNKAAANLRRVHEKLMVHIALVGHTGKQEDRGARGSNAHLGDVDVMVQISDNGGSKVAAIIKGNDTAARDLAVFSLELIETGRDEDGDPETTTIVSEAEGAAPQTRAPKKKLPDSAKAGLRALREGLADGPVETPSDSHIPVGSKCLTLEQWDDRLRKEGIINPKGNPSEEFKRIRVRLKNDGVIGIWDDYVWAIT